jgi:hypothetical protein
VPLSGDPEGRARQLANLRKAPPPAPPLGNVRSVRRGGYSTSPRMLPIEGKARQIYELLVEDAPMRDPDGSLPAADRTARRAARRCAWHAWRAWRTG